MESSGSLLHPKIARFYETNEAPDQLDSIHDCINEDRTYNWNKLRRLLYGNGEWQSDDHSYPTTYDEFLCYFLRLEPLLHLSHQVVAHSGDNSWLGKLEWLHQRNQIQTMLHEHRHPTSEVSPVENVLLLTSILEHGLGNIFYTITGKSPPHLLRDLFDTLELKELLGGTAILFLKVLMGSPESVNLRNIVWHGFPLPSEIHPCYTSTLLIAAASISALIEEHQVEVQSRLRLTDFSRHSYKILKPPIDLGSLSDTDRIAASIENSKWTCHSNHKLYWHRVLEHFQKKHFWRCVVLILPQIELVLRRMFGEANSFDITAKLEEYYITLNSIFESEDNGLLAGGLSRGVIHLMYDVFVSPYGMRIRDKVSHGEVDLNCIERNVCSILLYIGLNLITSNSACTLDGYTSHFHLNCLAADCIESSKRCLTALRSLQVPSDLGLDFKWDEDSMASLPSLVVQKPENIFNGHKKQPELFTFLMRIAQLITQACENYRNSFDERFRMHIKRELRSRARKTLHKMVEAMPSIAICLQNIVQHLVVLNNNVLKEHSNWLDNRFVDIQRFCKQTLRIVENIARYSDKESNEWLNVLECCSYFDKVSRKLALDMS